MATTVKLRAGPLEAEFEDGGLRAIVYDGVEIVRGVYAAVRDRDWDTVTPEVDVRQLRQSEGETKVLFQCRHARDEIDFEWDGTLDMSEDGVRFDFDGIARASFLKNRIGFCVLHPMEFAGLPVDVHTEEGVVRGAFPAAISPHQPFKAIREMVYEPADGLRVRMTFTGDLFEMEDQRNWTDASYKTYCTPLERPYPVRVRADERIKQSVRIEIERTGDRFDKMPHGERSCPVLIEVLQESVGSLPEIGFAIPADGISPVDARMIAELKPAYLRDTIDLTGSGWTDRWAAARAAATRIGCGLELEVLLDADEQAAPAAAELAERLAADGIGTSARETAVRLLPYAKGAVASDEATLRAVREAMRDRGLNVPLGGGSRAYYAEFNRAALPLGSMDFAAYTINPQVHAFDDRSLMETLAAQRVTAADAAAKSGKPLSIGPITFKPRLNPNATSGDGSIPVAEQADDRQGAEFGAAWTLGSLAALCMPAARRLTYYEASGPLGLVRDGSAIPAYHVLKEVMKEPAAQVLAVQVSSGRASALALRRPDGGARLLVANLTPEPLEVMIRSDRRFILSPYGWTGIESGDRVTDAAEAIEHWKAEEKKEGM